MHSQRTSAGPQTALNNISMDSYFGHKFHNNLFWRHQYNSIWVLSFYTELFAL